MPITIDKQGRRFYLRGDTYPVRARIQAAGAVWDGDARAWYTGRKDRALALVQELGGGTRTQDPNESLASNTTIAGKATYKGRAYLLLWEGDTKRGTAAKLAFADGSKVFWAPAGEYQVTKTYESMTFGKLSRLREEYRCQQDKPSHVGERTDIMVQYQGTRNHRSPSESIGSTRWIKHRGELAACTLVGYELATFFRGEDAEDTGNYDSRDGWYGTTYYRPATLTEAAALEKAEAPAKEDQRARAARAAVEDWLSAQLQWDAPGVETVHDTGKLPETSAREATIVIGRKAGASGILTDGGTAYALTATTVVAHHGGYYDDYRSSTRTLPRTEEFAKVIRMLAAADAAELLVFADRIGRL